MISRSIASAKKHGINLKHGSSNPGTGDCAFEAIIQNVNDRSQFKEKFPMSVDWYRRTWAIDMANRTIATDFNTMTNKEWMEGWKEMQNPGTYERGIFGDLMLPGIACGIRKYLLIFNTNISTPHDPIYVVDPSNFNVRPDTDIPLVLSYNMSHYESMEPCTEVDVEMTIELVNQYLSGSYRYKKQDMPYLISSQVIRKEDELVNDKERRNKIERMEQKKLGKKDVGETESRTLMNIEESSTAEADKEGYDQCNDNQEGNMVGNAMTESLNNSENEQKPRKKARSNSFSSNAQLKLLSESIENILLYKMKNKSEEQSIKQIGGMMECPICKVPVKNVSIHFERKVECGKRIDLVDFSNKFEVYKKEANRRRRIKDNANERRRQLEKDPSYYKHAMGETRKKQAEKDPEKKKKAEEEVRRRQLEKDPSYYKDAVRKTRKKQPEKYPEKKKKACCVSLSKFC